MRQILDLHIHSRYSRACSPQLTLAGIDAACRTKGIDIIATGDFTYPKWAEMIREELKETHPGSGLYILKTAADDKIKFILSTEVALIYKSGGRCRRIHLVVHAPNREAAEDLRLRLDAKFNVRSDGRPILGMSAPDFVRLCRGIHPDFLVYPAHIWTPWFSVFGSKSGFDKLEDCFEDQTPYIYAYETGLSSDPEMNWRVSALDNLVLVSNSDAHSLENLGREANVWDLDKLSYAEIFRILKNRDFSKILYTLEFYPEEGMYHFDGHRNCSFCSEPTISRRLKGICPVCHTPLTLGVAYRVEELADRPAGYQLANHPGFKKLVELDKIIAEAFKIKSRKSKKVQIEYRRLIAVAGSELPLLLEVDLSTLKDKADPLVLEGIARVRAGRVEISPGYDGRYGEIKIFKEKDFKKQTSLI
jgi:uncharacterized protein (TIGR00375 family)